MQTENYVVCLKYGNKYSSEYVNKLYSMVSRNLDLPYTFICITDDKEGINPSINCIDLKTDTDIEGWWYKIFLFDPDFLPKGNLLFIDLDVIIFNSINKFFNYKPEQLFCISRGFAKTNKHGMNSSCFRLNTGAHSHIYTEFMKNKRTVMNRLHGDQDWIQEQITEYDFWPENWLSSYKWDMKDKEQHHIDTAIAVFHGKPKPHELKTVWVKENWR